MARRELIPPREAAPHIGVAEQTLANWRYRGEGPRFYRVGQLIKYDRSDLDAWLDERASEPVPAA